MYVWLWRHLPGNAVLRALQCLALAAVVVTALFVWVFPRVEARLPYSDVTVPGPSSTSGPSPVPSELPAG